MTNFNGVDLLLGLLLLTLAGTLLHARTLSASIPLFIAFGLLVAIAWSRLGAPDLALAETAIGAGLTGVLFLGALFHARPERPSTHLRPRKLLALVLGIFLLGLILQALQPLPNGPVILADLAHLRVPDSGVEHPVTAVLLNFRAWDTLLELLVVLFALLGVRQLHLAALTMPSPWPLLSAWGRLWAPLTVLVGTYLLWRGSSAPGGAFQAGAVLAGGVVILRLNQVLPPLGWRHGAVRSLTLGGVSVFVLVAILTAVFGAGWLTYPPDWSTALIIGIEVTASLSIATTLALVVAGKDEELH